MGQQLRVAGSAMLLVAALVAAGCGGTNSIQAGASSSSGDSSTASGSLSRREFTARVEAVCDRLNKGIMGTKPKSASRQEIERVAPHTAALEQAAVRELATVTPPAVIASEWRRIMAYRRTLANELAMLARDARINDIAGIRTLVASKSRVHKELMTAATRAGFKSCSLVG